VTYERKIAYKSTHYKIKTDMCAVCMCMCVHVCVCLCLCSRARACAIVRVCMGGSECDLLKKNCILVNTVASNSATCERRPLCILFSTCCIPIKTTISLSRTLTCTVAKGVFYTCLMYVSITGIYEMYLHQRDLRITQHLLIHCIFIFRKLVCHELSHTQWRLCIKLVMTRLIAWSPAFSRTLSYRIGETWKQCLCCVCCSQCACCSVCVAVIVRVAVCVAVSVRVAVCVFCSQCACCSLRVAECVCCSQCACCSMCV